MAGAAVATFPSELGWMTVVWHAGRLTRLTLGHSTARAAGRAAGTVPHAEGRWTAELDQLVRRLQQYAAGAIDDFLDVTVDLEDRTRFQRAVLQACRRIAFGQTLTYGELAARVGAPRAARAVGSVMAGNRTPLVIPCHRVVRSGGSLGGFSAPGGLRLKTRLLQMERLSSIR